MLQTRPPTSTQSPTVPQTASLSRSLFCHAREEEEEGGEGGGGGGGGGVREREIKKIIKKAEGRGAGSWEVLVVLKDVWVAGVLGG